jgi:hypothetical protein
VALPRYHLWAEVACSAHKTLKEGRLCEVVLRKAKVCQSDVALIVEQTILGLEIAIQNLLGMKIFQAKQDFAKIEHAIWLLKAATLMHMEE